MSSRRSSSKSSSFWKYGSGYAASYSFLNSSSYICYCCSGDQNYCFYPVFLPMYLSCAFNSICWAPYTYQNRILKKNIDQFTYICTWIWIEERIKVHRVILHLFMPSHILQWCLRWIVLYCWSRDDVLAYSSELILFFLIVELLLVLNFFLFGHSFFHLRTHWVLHSSHHPVGCRWHLRVRLVWRAPGDRIIMHTGCFGTRWHTSGLIKIIQCVVSSSSLRAIVIIHSDYIFNYK